MEVVRYCDYGGHELIPAYHMRLVRKSLQWCYSYSGIDADYRCFNSLEEALLRVAWEWYAEDMFNYLDAKVKMGGDP